MGGMHSDYIRIMTGNTKNKSLINSSFGAEDPNWRWDTLKEGMDKPFYEDSFHSWFFNEFHDLPDEPWIDSIRPYFNLMMGADQEIKEIANDGNTIIYFCPLSAVNKYLKIFEDVRLPEKENDGFGSTCRILAIAAKEEWDLYIYFMYGGGE
jgi:hypothetical protein